MAPRFSATGLRGESGLPVAPPAAAQLPVALTAAGLSSMMAHSSVLQMGDHCGRGCWDRSMSMLGDWLHQIDRNVSKIHA